MSIQDEEFIRRLRATFRIEADEHVQTILSRLLELEKSPSSEHFAAAIDVAFREAHSLKGAARAVDFANIEAVCQSLESVFAAWKRLPAAPNAEAFDRVHHALDEIRSLLESSAGGARESGLSTRETEPVSFPPLGGTTLKADPHAPAEPAPPRPFAEHDRPDTVRVAVDKVEAQLRRAEELLAAKSIGMQHVKECQALTGMMKEWHRKWNRISPNVRAFFRDVASEQDGTLAQVAQFLDWNRDFVRSLEARISAAGAQAQRDRHFMDRRVEEVLEDSRRLLMLPFSTATGLFPKLVRDLCREQCKEAELVITGSALEIDKRILEDMKDILTHVLRNCVDHGVETPGERRGQNKPPHATINIRVSPINGSKVEVVVTDDGGGIDVAKLKASAVSRQVLSQAQADALPTGEALSLVFQSGVSTSPAVTTISGRGLGMAIVRSKVDALEGRVSIESMPGAGTTLRMVLPLRRAIFRGVLLEVAEHTFAIATANVERLLRIPMKDIQTVENREVIAVAGDLLSLVRLGAMLGLPSENNAPQETVKPVVIVQAMGKRMAWLVDGVLNEQEVQVKPFRRPLVRVRHFAGAAVVGNGKVVPVLHVPDLMHSAATQGAPPTLQPAPGTTRAATRRILVAEDSMTSRMLLKGILTAAGYEVRTAVDGMDAYRALREELVDIVVSDVEMPRLNGFDLTARIRADARLADVPVILLTALESREQRERGMEVGANAYLVKSSFEQGALLDIISRLI